MGGSSKKQTVGYRYFLGMHMILCHGPADKLIRIKVDDKKAWVGAVSSQSIYVDASDLFGGESREGGVSGTVDVEMGTSTQGQNSYLVSKLGSLVPSFRGVVGIVLRQCYLGVNPYLKKWAFRLKRIHLRQNGISQWYDSKSEIAAPTLVPESFSDSCSSLSGYTLAGVVGAIQTDGSVIFNNADQADNNTTATKYFSEKIFVTQASFDLRVTQGNNGDAMRLALINYAGSQIFQFFPRVEQYSDTLRRPALNSQSYLIGTAALVVGTWYSVTLNFDETGCDVIIKNKSNGSIYGQLRINGLLGSSIAGIRFVRDGDTLGSNTASATAYDNIKISGYIVVDDMNPAHIIRECLTDPDWGMGYQDADIDDTSFIKAADALYAEGMGISLLWDRQTSIEEFIKEIVKHIDAALFVDRQTGKFTLKLIRNDYVLADLLVLNPSNVDKIADFTRPAFGELTNSITVNYWDSATGTDASLTVQDIALSQMQGVTINTTVQYPGFTNKQIASRVAQRDLKTLSTPLISCTIYANRDAASLNIGSCFKLTWPDYDLNEVVMRVTGIAYGDGRTNRVRINCSQDVFSLPETSFIPPTPPIWEDPNSDAAPAPYRVVVEAPYYELVQRLGQTNADQQISANNDIGYLIVSAAAPSGAINGRLAVDNGAGYENNDYPMDFCPVGFLTGAVDYDDTVIPLTGFVGSSSVVLGTHAQIGSELVKITAVASDSITVGRGVLDTVPTSHAAGTPVLFWDAFGDSDNVEYVTNETINVKILPTTGRGTLAIDSAPEDSLTFASRAYKPYPPGNVKVNSLAYPATISSSDALTVSWSHRDRLQQTAGDIVDTTAGNIGPEAGTTYTLKIYKEDGTTLLHTESGVSTTSYTYPLATEISDSLIASGGSGGELYYDAVMLDGPYAYWRMGESSGTTATDSSGNGRNGTYSGTVTLGQSGLQSGDSNTSAYFNPASDNSQMDCGFSTNLTTAFTLEMIIKPDATQPDNAPNLIAKGSYYATSATDFPVFFRYNLSAKQVSLFLSKGDDYSSDLTLSSGADTVPVNTVSIVHAVYRANGQCELWVNGVMKASSTINFTVSSNTRNWMVGAAPFVQSGGIGEHRFAGIIDEVAIYNKALSSTRIQAHATAVSNTGTYRQNGKLRFTLQSVRGGYNSYQMHDYTVSRTGYGFNYGERYGS